MVSANIEDSLHVVIDNNAEEVQSYEKDLDNSQGSFQKNIFR